MGVGPEGVIALKVSLLFSMHQKEKKMMPTFGMFLKCIRGAAVVQIRRLLLKKWKASSKECWVRTHISFQNAVQLRLWIFWSCVRNGKAAL